MDAEAILDGVNDHGQDLDWRKSPVDLMNLPGLDSSLGASKTLAHERNHDGDMNDSISITILPRQQAMAKLAENGGEVPAWV